MPDQGYSSKLQNGKMAVVVEVDTDSWQCQCVDIYGPNQNISW